MDKELQHECFSRPSFAHLNDLASNGVGGKIVFATDDWFAVAENLLKPSDPEWHEGVFTSFGKWMDGWETRRKRIPGHDWCVIKLGIPGVIKGLHVDTAFFTGNFPPRVSVQGAYVEEGLAMLHTERKSEMGTNAPANLIEELDKLTGAWSEILPMTALRPGYSSTRHNYFAVNNQQRWTHLRLNLYPDGGIARLRVYGTAVKDWTHVALQKLPVDLTAMVNGGTAEGWSNMHYGHPRNLIAPGTAANMGDGWETARRMDRPSILEQGKDGCLNLPGCEWSVIQLGHPGTVQKIEIDTNHFKGNFPESCKVEGFLRRKKSPNDINTKDWSSCSWKTILPRTKLSPDKLHQFTELEGCGAISHVRLIIYPDGGVSRLRCWGVPAPMSEYSKL
ncbi:allantoicase-like isoform X1 [Acropora palmata]|uniref:allantoicase-like isoform X1 n=1 Tax=Acropora palmata TaxID=6131 RepID=UPI003DA0FF03